MEFNRLRSSMPFGGLTREEILRGAANRLMYSKFYTYYYAGMFLLGLVSLITAFVETCPSLFFIIIESILCICMMLEIITRAVAMQRSFLTSWWNYFDIVIVLFCGVTLILMAKGGCSSSSEELINTILLVIRNAAQVFRLFAMLRKNRRQMEARDTNVDLGDGEDFLGFINDMDGLAFEAEGEYHIPGGHGADNDEFRLSIGSLDGEDAVGLGPGFDSALNQPSFARRSDSRSSATSVQSNSDRLTGRKRAPGGGS
ncbi:hypothetical protein GGH91_001146 [Coemansia sp. RSA 2671]|nr:hypothetical protein GGH91_001146 [Coemansia sp. RSA 2671]